MHSRPSRLAARRRPANWLAVAQAGGRLARFRRCARGGYPEDGRTENDGQNVFLSSRTEECWESPRKAGPVWNTVTVRALAAGRVRWADARRMPGGPVMGRCGGGGAVRVRRRWTLTGGDKAEGHAWEGREDQKGPMGICGSVRCPSLSPSHQPGLALIGSPQRPIVALLPWDQQNTASSSLGPWSLGSEGRGQDADATEPELRSSESKSESVAIPSPPPSRSHLAPPRSLRSIPHPTRPHAPSR